MQNKYRLRKNKFGGFIRSSGFYKKFTKVFKFDVINYYFFLIRFIDEMTKTWT